MNRESLNDFLGEVPPPPEDSLILHVEIDEEDVHFLDAVIDGYDGIANVRREYRVVDGNQHFLLYTSPGLVGFTVARIRELRRYIYIGEINVEGVVHDS